MAVEHMPPGWVTNERGAVRLLNFLQGQGRRLVALSRSSSTVKRRRGEGMATWIVRHDEALLEAKRTLAEAIQEYSHIGPSTSPGTTSRGDWQASIWTGSTRWNQSSSHTDQPTAPGMKAPRMLQPGSSEFGDSE